MTRLLAAPVVAVALVTGVWVTGGVVTRVVTGAAGRSPDAAS